MANIKFSQFSAGNNLQVGDIVVGLRSGANTKFTFPSSGINDSSNNPMIAWASPGASAVNYLTLNSALTAVNPSITVAGTDSDIGLTLNTKGNGNINIDPTGTGIITMQASARFANASAIQTGTTNSDTLLFQAYDVDGASYTTLMTMTAGNTPSLSINASSLILSTPLAVTSGGTGTSTQFTAGSVIFAGASGIYTQDNTNLFYDKNNFRLGVGTNTPSVDLDVDGITATTFLQCQNLLDSSGGLVLQLLHNSTPVNSFYMYNTGTLNSPIFGVQGSDTDIGMLISAKGAGQINHISTNSTPLVITSGTNSHSTSFAFANTAQTRTVTFPDASGTVAFTSGASGIVNSGTANQLAYYATTGTTLSGLTTANNGVLVTDGSGVPSISTTLPSNLLIQSPKIGLILDTNANGMLKLSPISSSVNYFEFKNAATAGTPIITLTGTDSNIPLKLLTIGTGQLSLQSAHATQPILIASGTGLQHVTSLNFSNTSASRDVTFPDATGTLLMTGVAINSVPSITFSSTSGIIGTTTNDSAAAGSVGEYVESVLGSGSAVSLSNGTGTNITSISLTAGDWDFWGQYNVTFNSTTVYTRQGGQISTTSGTIVSTGSAAPTNDVTHPSVTSGGEILFNPIGMGRISLSGTTTLYLNTRCFFSVSTATAYGFLAARRRR